MRLSSCLIRIATSTACSPGSSHRAFLSEARSEGKMKPKTIYLILCFFGLILTYWQFVPWVAQNGLNMSLFFHQLFANRISAFFGMDVFVSAAALLVFMRTEGSRLDIPSRWLSVMALVLVGVSLALPLFLYLRERKLDHLKPTLATEAAR